MNSNGRNKRKQDAVEVSGDINGHGATGLAKPAAKVAKHKEKVVASRVSDFDDAEDEEEEEENNADVLGEGEGEAEEDEVKSPESVVMQEDASSVLSSGVSLSSSSSSSASMMDIDNEEEASYGEVLKKKPHGDKQKHAGDMDAAVAAHLNGHANYNMAEEGRTDAIAGEFFPAAMGGAGAGGSGPMGEEEGDIPVDDEEEEIQDDEEEPGSIARFTAKSKDEAEKAFRETIKKSPTTKNARVMYFKDILMNEQAPLDANTNTLQIIRKSVETDTGTSYTWTTTDVKNAKLKVHVFMPNIVLNFNCMNGNDGKENATKDEFRASSLEQLKRSAWSYLGASCEADVEAEDEAAKAEGRPPNYETAKSIFAQDIKDFATRFLRWVVAYALQKNWIEVEDENPIKMGAYKSVGLVRTSIEKATGKKIPDSDHLVMSAAYSMKWDGKKPMSAIKKEFNGRRMPRKSIRYQEKLQSIGREFLSPTVWVSALENVDGHVVSKMMRFYPEQMTMSMHGDVFHLVSELSGLFNTSKGNFVSTELRVKTMYFVQGPNARPVQLKRMGVPLVMDNTILGTVSQAELRSRLTNDTMDIDDGEFDLPTAKPPPPAKLMA
jgi:hypothetical protein